MTTYYLIRHGSTDHIGRFLSGRIGDIHLDETGRAQAALLAKRLENVPIRTLYSSPLSRAVETAEPLARQAGIAIRTNSAFDEFDFGDWSGKSFTELDSDPEWRRFNDFRSGTQALAGEFMLEVQARAVAELERLRLVHVGEAIAIFSHGDVIRAILCHYSGMPLDLFQRLEVSPASISVLTLDESGPRVPIINSCGTL